ncbi:MAG: hypothetical protein H7039_05125, partial [Bryobacteraceae bacterium]|nr:hypothetical protein [Bryobacteraceae bacterium]
MSRTLPLFLLVSSCAFSQQSSGKPPTTAALVENTPETVIAVVNGRNFTVGDLQKMLPSLPQQLKQLVATQPKTALEQYALGESLSREAEKLKLQDTSPYREELENVRRQVLSQAAIRQRASQIQIDPAEISKHYEANQADFRQAQVRIIFVSRGTFTQALSGAPTKPQDPEENKKKAETAAKLALAG